MLYRSHLDIVAVLSRKDLEFSWSHLEMAERHSFLNIVFQFRGTAGGDIHFRTLNSSSEELWGQLVSIRETRLCSRLLNAQRGDETGVFDCLLKTQVWMPGQEVCQRAEEAVPGTL